MEALLEFGQTVLWFLAVFTVVVFIHEFGHYGVARLCGVRVEVFSIGFGRELLGRTSKSGTRWKLSAVPLGVYVKFFCDEGPSSRIGDHIERMKPADRAVCFHFKPLAQRAAVVAAGPLANFVLAIALLMGLYMSAGQPTTPAVVGEVLADSAAEEAGFMAGDRVVRIDSKTIERFEQLREIVMFNPGLTMNMGVVRDGETIAIDVTPRAVERTGPLGNVHIIGQMGISVAAGEYVRLGPLTAFGAAITETYSLVKRSLQGLFEILTGRRDSSELGGPIMIAQMSGQSAEAGILPLIEFVVILSATLGLINLFPIPLLDGGHLAFYALEAVRGRPLGERAQEVGFMIGFALVVSLMAYATFNDLTRPAVLEFFAKIVG